MIAVKDTRKESTENDRSGSSRDHTFRVGRRKVSVGLSEEAVFKLRPEG